MRLWDGQQSVVRYGGSPPRGRVKEVGVGGPYTRGWVTVRGGGRHHNIKHFTQLEFP